MSTSPVPKKEIMVVDDSEFDRDLITQFLLRKDFEVVAVPNGATCLEKLKAKMPDLVLLDIMMPGLQGPQVLHLIRGEFNHVELPVLMMTAKTDASDVMEALYLGANDYITKPVDFEVALMRIRTHLGISDLSRATVRLREVEIINAMISTYNHEINNPLAIALGSLKSFKGRAQNDHNFDRLENALWRIAEIVKKIAEIKQLEQVPLEDYTDDLKILKLRK